MILQQHTVYSSLKHYVHVCIGHVVMSINADFAQRVQERVPSAEVRVDGRIVVHTCICIVVLYFAAALVCAVLFFWPLRTIEAVFLSGLLLQLLLFVTHHSLTHSLTYSLSPLVLSHTHQVALYGHAIHHPSAVIYRSVLAVQAAHTSLPHCLTPPLITH
jgi:hypothetical protein